MRWGVPTMQVSAGASARWGYVSGGVTFPLTFSWCAFYQATGGWDDQGKPLSDSIVVINMDRAHLHPPAHNEVPGGFGWMSGVHCAATVSAGDWVASDPGNDGSGTCKDFDWSKRLGEPASQLGDGAAGSEGAGDVVGCAGDLLRCVAEGAPASGPGDHLDVVAAVTDRQHVGLRDAQ